jgi:hypothetical protein
VIGHRRVVTFVLALILTAPAGCGEQVDLAPRAQRQLQSVVDEVRAAVTAADRIGARSALRDLERAVSSLVDSGQISEDRAADILAAAREVADQLSLLPAPEPSPSPSAEATTSPTPEPTDDPGHGDEANGNGHGNAYGHDEGHGNGD